MSTMTNLMMTYFIIMFATLILQSICLIMKDKDRVLKSKLFILIIIMATATGFSGLAAGSYIAPLWFGIAILIY